MTKVCRGDCSTHMMQHQKKKTDQASVYTQREDSEWKYQKKSVAGVLVCKLSVPATQATQTDQCI